MVCISLSKGNTAITNITSSFDTLLISLSSFYSLILLNASGTIAAIQAGFRSIGVTGSSAALVIIGHPNDLDGLPSAMEESNGRTQRKMGVNDQQKKPDSQQVCVLLGKGKRYMNRGPHWADF